MYTISFKNSYASIIEFPGITLPGFTLITGVNGVGKTHFLRAIALGALQTSAAPAMFLAPEDSRRLYDSSTMIFHDEEAIGSESVREERRRLWYLFKNATQPRPMVLDIQGNSLVDAPGIKELRQELQAFGLPQHYLANPLSLGRGNGVEIEKEIGPDKFASFQEAYSNMLFRFEQEFLLKAFNPRSLEVLREIADQKKCKISQLTELDIMEDTTRYQAQGDLFQKSFSSIFLEYRDLYFQNVIREFSYEKGYSTRPYMSQDEFIKKVGPPPWDLVNEIINSLSLNLKINRPPFEPGEPYRATLTKISSDAEFPFSKLSAGEKIIMSFACCIYSSSDSGNIATLPKVLLFDEVDASLHPSMARNLIKTIQEILVEKLKIQVIMTTHSPSTVALAPEGSIYTMRTGKPGLHPTKKAEALNILTAGIPTLAISYDGRRQVFVESPNDAIIYDAIYGKMKPNLNSDRSLEFIATGMEVNNQHYGTGCAILKKTVTELSKCGNASVYGLVDWDRQHQPSNRLAVLAHNRFDGMENVLLDPFLVGLLITLECTSHKSHIGLKSEEHFINIINSSTERKQELADKVAICIFGVAPSKTITKKYRGGLVLNVDSETATTDDHEYEGKIIEAFKFLINAFNKHPQKLMGKLVDAILMNYPEFIPQEFEDVFLEILNKPTHSDEP